MQENDGACFCLTTESFAQKQLVFPQTVIKRLSQTGSYFGVVPKKLRNGRWAWPDEQVVGGAK